MRRGLVLALLAALLPFGSAGAVLQQDDAGSGQDAPDTRDPMFRVDPGRSYDGLIEGTLTDGQDWYAVVARSGQRLSASASGVLGCFYLFDSAGVQLDFGCPTGRVTTATVSTVATYSGTYYLRYSYVQPDAYRFSVALNEEPPPPSEVPEVVEGDPEEEPPAWTRPATQGDKHVVVAVVDTGINPYHAFFRAPALSAHPSRWLARFPRKAAPVRLTLGAGDLASAQKADEPVWDEMERTVYSPSGENDNLYTFPGTRIVAGISFGEYQDTAVALPGSAPPRPVRDDHGHGTHSAGLAGGVNLPDPDGNVLIVAVEVGKGSFETGIKWAAQQPWIDAISVSLGNVANVPTGVPNGIGNGTGSVAWITREAYASGKPVFVASGNGVTSTGVAPDKCTTYTSPYVGPVWVARIGAASASEGNPTYWHCVPVEATARTRVPSPDHDSLEGESKATGTSASTPNAAGHWAHLMLDARRGGVRVSRLRTLEYLLRAAAPPPLTVSADDPSVYPASLADQGYGLIDAAAVDRARGTLLGGGAPAARPETAEWFAQDRATRIRLWGAPPEQRTGT